MTIRPGEFFLALWCASFCAIGYAQATFAQEVAHYDWPSLGFAFAAGLLGGSFRTIVTLMTRERLVGNVAVVLLKDLVVALVGGGAAYLFVEGYNSWVRALSSVELPAIERGLRMLIIVGAGASRKGWLSLIDSFTSDAIANARHKLRGSAPRDPPVSVNSPLADK